MISIPVHSLLRVKWCRSLNRFWRLLCLQISPFGFYSSPGIQLIQTLTHNIILKAGSFESFNSFWGRFSRFSPLLCSTASRGSHDWLTHMMACSMLKIGIFWTITFFIVITIFFSVVPVLFFKYKKRSYVFIRIVNYYYG